MDALLNTAPCGYIAIGDDGTILEVNETLAATLGYTRIELLGWHLDKILPAGGRIFYHTYVFPLLKVQERIEEIYIAFRTKESRDIPMLLNGRRSERDGRPLSDCFCMRIIQRHEFEDQLVAARRLAEESSAAREKFLSMMTHDIRAPLTTIYGNAQLLASGGCGDLNEEQSAVLHDIIDACRVQMTLISDILDFARLNSGKVNVSVEPVAISEVLARARPLVRAQVREAGLTLRMDAGESAVALADPNRLQQVLINLLTNAIKFTPAGGSITVWCDRDEERVRIRVRDTGIGIPHDHLQNIFTPFVQLESGTFHASAGHPHGIGLGLAISRELANAMGGDITVESTPSSGSLFTIDLPASPVAVRAHEDATVK